MADTDFVPLPGGDATALLASAYLARRAALIGERSAGRALLARLVRALEARGHALQQVPMTSGLQAIQRRLHDSRSAWFGATDPRGEGEAAAD